MHKPKFAWGLSGLAAAVSVVESPGLPVVSPVSSAEVGALAAAEAAPEDALPAELTTVTGLSGTGNCAAPKNTGPTSGIWPVPDDEGLTTRSLFPLDDKSIT